MTERPNDIEQVFLREIAAKPSDNTARLIYADWLDEQGDPRAEYLRVHCELSTLSPGDEHYQTLLHRERELQAGTDPDWLRQVGQPRIENCDGADGLLEFAYQCPKAWNGLRPTEKETIRHCEACEKDVYFCEDIDTASCYASLGCCIAVDTSLVRREGDLLGHTVIMGAALFPEPHQAVAESPRPGRKRRGRRSRRKSE